MVQLTVRSFSDAGGNRVFDITVEPYLTVTANGLGGTSFRGDDYWLYASSGVPLPPDELLAREPGNSPVFRKA